MPRVRSRFRLGAMRAVAAAPFLALVVVFLLASVPAQPLHAQLSPEQQLRLEQAVRDRAAEVERAAEARASAPSTSAEAAAGVPSGAPDSGPAAAGPAPTQSPSSVLSRAVVGEPPPPAGALESILLSQVLRDPAARRALRDLLTALDGAAGQGLQPAAPAAESDGSAVAATPAPGPGVGAGTGGAGMAGLARAALGAGASGGSGGGSGGGSEGSAGQAEAAPEDGAGTPDSPVLPSAGLSWLTGVFQDFYRKAIWTSGLTTEVPQVLDWLAVQASETMRGQWLNLASQIALVVVAGLTASVLVRLFTGRAARRLRQAAEQATPLRRVTVLVIRLLLTLVPIAVFAAAAQATLPLIDAPLRTELVAAAVITSLVLMRAAVLVLNGLLTPEDSPARLLPVTDDSARALARGLRRIVLTMLVGYLLVEVARLLGMPPGGRSSLMQAVALVTLVLTLHALFKLRRVGQRAIRRLMTAGGLTSAWAAGMVRGLSDIWHLLAGAYAIGIFFAWSLESERWFVVVGLATVKTVLICVIVALVFRWVQDLRDRGMMRLHGAASFDRAARQRGRRYIGLAANTARAVVAAGALLLVLESWHVGAVAWLTEGGGSRLATIIFNSVLVLAVSVALWEGVNHFIQRYLSTTDTAGNIIERGQRERTLLPLLRNVLTVILVIVVALMLLSELGVNIAPLLAGAGVVGLAIGFGSQKLVQDVISGVFTLLEDTIAVGDVVQVGGHAGVVEAMSIRSLRLRDLSGNLHTLPFSNVDTVTNMTKDFSYYLMEVRVSYREDTDEVVEVLNAISAELREDEEYGPSILEAIEVLGVDGFSDSAVIIKARLKTKPIMQWWVGREFNRRMKKRFNALGIEMPFPHMTVYFGMDKQGNAPPAHLHIDRLAAMGARGGTAAGGGGTPPPGRPVVLPAEEPGTSKRDAPSDEGAARRASLPDPDGSGPGDSGR